MAKFRSGNLHLKDGQKAVFGDIHNLWSDGSELQVDTTISGVDPTQSYHLATRSYVDSLSGSYDEHNEMLNIQGGTTDEYYHLTNAQHTDLTDSGDCTIHHHDGMYYTETELDAGQLDNRYYTETELDAGQLDNRYFTETEHIDTSAGVGDAGKPIKLDAAGHVDASMINNADIDHASITNTHNLTTDIDHDSITNTHNLTTDIDHGSISGLTDDDHTQYILADGSRAFTSTVVGVTPTLDDHLTTKDYVDSVSVDKFRAGRESLSLDDSSKAVTFGVAFADTNYTISVMLTTTDAIPSIYSTVVNNKANTGFTVVFSGDIDSANYELEWSAKHD